MVGASASAATLDGGATITNPTNNLPLVSGVGTDLFTIDLPAQAACSGDTATQGYHVYSYVIAATKPDTKAALTKKLKSINPVTGFGTTFYPLAEQSGIFYGAHNTAQGTGQIIGLPLDFQWSALNSVLTRGGQKPLYGTTTKTDEIGFFCANSANAVTDYWNQEVIFTKKAAASGGFAWKLGKHV